MFRSLLKDGLFTALVLLETLALLNIFRVKFAWPLRGELEPVLAFYETSIAPITSFPAHFIFAAARDWYGDAYFVSAVVGFLFFIRQARRAVAPHEADDGRGEDGRGEDGRGVLESGIDRAFAFAVAGIAAAALSFALLPLLTPLIAVWLGLAKLAGRPSWYQISRSYFWNLLFVTALSGTALYLSL